MPKGKSEAPSVDWLKNKGEFVFAVNEIDSELSRVAKRIKEWRRSDTSPWSPSPERAALKRASMDLSRALARLRRTPATTDGEDDHAEG